MVWAAIFWAVVGATMGSFVGALVWRVKTGRDFVRARSECQHCHHKLMLLDLIPILSWLWLSGRCRYCSKPIGVEALLLELVMAALFAVSYIFWPYWATLGLASVPANILFGVWLGEIVLLAALFVYDVRWMLLPDKFVWPLVGLGVVGALIAASASSQSALQVLDDRLLGLLPVSGLYGMLYVVSRGRWVGLGDVKLGVFMGLALGWQKALLVVALANVIGFLVVMPGLAAGKLDRRSHVPFGPFLIAAFFVAGLWGDAVLKWYLGMVLMV